MKAAGARVTAWRGYLLRQRGCSHPGYDAATLRALVERGELVFKEDIAIGLANFPEHFLKQFTGQNQGKLVLKRCSRRFSITRQL